MDIQKEREAFERLPLAELAIKSKYVYYSEKTNSYCPNEDFCPSDAPEAMNFAWEAWQVAKAQAVPEGFVLINKSDRNQEMLELIDQRDYMESQAEELKDKLQALYGVDFGEHSSCNFPFQNAIDYDDSDLVLVPKEPTPKMIDATWNFDEEIQDMSHNSRNEFIYNAMIAASQEPAND